MRSVSLDNHLMHNNIIVFKTNLLLYILDGPRQKTLIISGLEHSNY